MKARFISLGNIVLEAENDNEAIMMKNFYENSNSIMLDDWEFGVDEDDNINKFTISSSINIKNFASQYGIEVEVIKK
jgi:hypothetical protein